MATPRIFISMGTPYNDDSARFRDALENLLRDQCGADPRIIGKNEYPDGSPLNKIKSVIESCDGMIVVAYERKFLKLGVEKRFGSQPVGLEDKTYTTPWNHIESALAYSLGLPIYIICQRGLSEEGLIESKIDWYVQYVDIVPTELSRAEVSQSIAHWITSRVASRSKTPQFFRILAGSSKISELTPKEIAGVLGLIAASFSAGVAAVKLLPGIFK